MAFAEVVEEMEQPILEEEASLRRVLLHWTSLGPEDELGRHKENQGMQSLALVRHRSSSRRLGWWAPPNWG